MSASPCERSPSLSSAVYWPDTQNGSLFRCLLQPMDLDDVLSSQDSEDEVDEEELRSVDENVAVCTRLICDLFCVQMLPNYMSFFVFMFLA
jgi:hypothetical protein